MTRKRSNGTDVDELRDDIVETREDLGDTVHALSEKADVKTRTRKAASRKVAQVREGAQEAAGTVGEEVRRRPGRWAAAAAGVVMAAGAGAVGLMRWRRANRRPQRRAVRAWRGFREQVSSQVRNRVR